MQKLSPQKVGAARPFFRVLAGVLFVLSILAVFAACFALVIEGWNSLFIVIFIPPSLMAWIAFVVARTGYPPRFLDKLRR